MEKVVADNPEDNVPGWDRDEQDWEDIHPSESLQKIVRKRYKKAVVYLVMSLKGGCGKTTVACNLAYYLSEVMGYKTALWDCDITNPSVPNILGLKDIELENAENFVKAHEMTDKLSVFSIDFLLERKDQAILFDELNKVAAVQQYIKSVDFGPGIERIVLDSPPTNSAELRTILNIFKKPQYRLVFVTQPSDVSKNAVIKSMSFLKDYGFHVAGIVSNMDGHKCSKCGHVDQMWIERDKSVAELANEYGVPFLGSIPSGHMVEGDNGEVLISQDVFEPVAKTIVEGKGVKFDEKFKKLGLFRKAMIAFKMKKAMNKELKK